MAVCICELLFWVELQLRLQTERLVGALAKFDEAKSCVWAQKWVYVRAGGYYLTRLIKYVMHLSNVR